MSAEYQGKWLQDEIKRIVATYLDRGVARIEKTDPPCKIVGTGRGRRVIFMENPFLDFVGTWQARGGRTICIEAKSTEGPTLGICTSNGVTEDQWKNLQRWERCGAACCILWGYKHTIRFVRLGVVRAQQANGVKHVKWEDASAIAPGHGFCTFDFLKTLEAYFPG